MPPAEPAPGALPGVSPAAPPDLGLPGLTACSLCAGETLADGGPLDVPRAEQLERWRRLAADGVARVAFVECLDECERGDVVVARPSGACRSAGATPVWFEQVAGDGPVAEVAGWLRSGGPGAAAVPGPLRRHVIERSRD